MMANVMETDSKPEGDLVGDGHKSAGNCSWVNYLVKNLGKMFRIVEH